MLLAAHRSTRLHAEWLVAWTAFAGRSRTGVATLFRRFAVAHAGEESGRRIPITLQRLHEHRQVGDRVIIATACAEPLAKALCRALDLENDPALDQRLSDELDAYNRVAAGAGEQREFTVKIEDSEGHLIAGLSGWTWGTSAGIGMVWVREDQRRGGYGSRLLDAAEYVARERGCERINVSSFTFQAPGFYERHGYVEVGRTEALPLSGQADVHFVKHLR